MIAAPSATKCPRHGDGRKGAFGVASRWRRRHPCPRHHDEQRSQDEERGGYRVDTKHLTRTTSAPPERLPPPTHRTQPLAGSMTAVLTATSTTNQPTGSHSRTHQAQIRRVGAAPPAPVNRRPSAPSRPHP
jgi:hypothetical protein